MLATLAGVSAVLLGVGYDKGRTVVTKESLSPPAIVEPSFFPTELLGAPRAAALKSLGAPAETRTGPAVRTECRDTCDEVLVHGFEAGAMTIVSLRNGDIVSIRRVFPGDRRDAGQFPTLADIFQGKELPRTLVERLAITPITSNGVTDYNTRELAWESEGRLWTATLATPLVLLKNMVENKAVGTRPALPEEYRVLQLKSGIDAVLDEDPQSVPLIAGRDRAAVISVLGEPIRSIAGVPGETDCEETLVFATTANLRDRLAPRNVSACVKAGTVIRARWAWGGDTRSVESFGSPRHLGEWGFARKYPETAASDMYTKEAVTDSLTRSYAWIQGGVEWTARAHSPPMRVYDVEQGGFRWRASRKAEFRLMYVEQSVLAAPAEDTVFEPVKCGQEATLDESPRAKRRAEPLFPAQASYLRAPGVVEMLLYVDERGRMSEIVILRGHPFFEETSIDAVKRWRYEPLVINDCTLPWRTRLTLRFMVAEDASRRRDAKGR